MTHFGRNSNYGFSNAFWQRFQLTNLATPLQKILTNPPIACWILVLDITMTNFGRDSNYGFSNTF